MRQRHLFITLIVLSIVSLVSCSKDQGGSGEPVKAPKIFSISSKFSGKAVYGQPIVIKGENFSTQPGGNVVVFGKQEVTDLIAFSANEITVNAPRIASYSLMM